MIGQAFDLGPRYSVILAAQQICRLRASVKIAMRATEGPYLGKAVLEWKRGATPSNHLCKGRISGGPLIHLAGGETRQLPGCPAVFRTPDPRPCQSPPPPAQIKPVSASPNTWLIGQPSQCGPVTFQPLRSRPPSIRKAPFVVPTRIVTAADVITFASAKCEDITKLMAA